jgi:hypothetical protein
MATITKRILIPERIRRIEGGFSYIPHRFLTDGFLASLEQKEILVYLFLVLVADRYGLSYYSYDMICSLLQLTLEEYLVARDGLLAKDLIDFDGAIFQVLSLPRTPRRRPRTPAEDDPATVARLIRQSLQEADRD